jgi:hypothetical protein
METIENLKQELEKLLNGNNAQNIKIWVYKTGI